MKPIDPAKPVYSNDRKAPRMRKGEFSKTVVTKKLFEKFKEEFPEYTEMEWKKFYESWFDIAEQVRYEAIFNPLGFKLGSYLGELKLQYIPYKLIAIDTVTSALEGRQVPFLNIESKGKVPRIKWERRWAVKFNKILQFYAFDPTRELNRLANIYMDEDNREKIRTARVTIGGHSVWRQKIKNK